MFLCLGNVFICVQPVIIALPMGIQGLELYSIFRIKVLTEKVSLQQRQHLCRIHKNHMGFLNRRRYTYKIKTTIHLIRRMPFIPSLSSEEFSFFLCSAPNGNKEYVWRVQIRKIIQAIKIQAGSLPSTLRIKSMNTSKQTNQRAKAKISAQARKQLVSSVNEPTQDRLQIKLLCCLLTVNRPNFICDSGDNSSLLKETKDRTMRPPPSLKNFLQTFFAF